MSERKPSLREAMERAGIDLQQFAQRSVETGDQIDLITGKRFPSEFDWKDTTDE